ncbi:MAG: NAD(P)H-quinone oxidoreductase subunit 3 [Corynebacteriales bacterium]|nr:NAD(P)H-quinone oxidoreductase subunit 3 [Mycobacteriales bacterium]
MVVDVTSSYLGQYASLALMLLVGVGFISVSLLANRFLRPATPGAAKLSAYECGVDAVEGDWARSQIRYYVYGYMYLLFAVEAIFLFPWILAFDLPGMLVRSAVEMGIFAALLALGLLYAWRKGVLRWV